MAVFLPGYQWVTNPRNGGGAYATNGPSSILLHMTVSMGVSASYISGHPYPPHLWANPYNGDRFQTVTLDRSAFALYQPDFGQSWTNRKGWTLQTEVVGVPEVSVATYTDAQCRWIGEQVVAPQAQWLASIGRPVNLNQVRYHPETGGSASEYWPGRMSENDWDAFNGLLAHIDVPYNDHWDCSAERLDQIAAYARAALGGTGGTVTPPDSLWRFLMTNDELTQKINDTAARALYTQTLVQQLTNWQNEDLVLSRDNNTVIHWVLNDLKDPVGTMIKGVSADVNAAVTKLSDQHGEIMATQGQGGTVATPTVKEVLVKATDQELYTEIARRAALPRATAADTDAPDVPTEAPPS